jgi:hypothetical protein
MLTEKHNEIWTKVITQVFDSINLLGEELKESPEIRAACLTEIIMPIYDYLLKAGGHENFQKCYDIYKAELANQEGELNS